MPAPVRVLFVHPHRESVRAHGLPHVGLALLASILRNEGYDVLVVDYMIAPGAPSLTHFLGSFSPDVVGISTYTAILSKAFKLIGLINDYNPKIPIIVGGPHATLYAEDFLRDGRVSYIVRGEAEEKIGEIISSAVKEKAPKIIDCQPIDVKNLLFPDFTCFYSFENIRDYPLSTSRGCPYRCSFCAVSSLTPGYRSREIDVCCLEITKARTLLPDLKSVSVTDDNSGVGRGRFRDFLLRYIERIDLPLGFAYIRGDSIDGEVLTLLKRAKTKSVCIAIEHAHPEVYKHINKGEELKDIIKAARLVREYGLILELCFIIGLPYDTFERTKCNIELAKRLKAATIFWNMLVPYKGTAARDWFLKNGRLLGETDKTSYVDYSCFYDDEPAAETKDMTAEERKKAYFYAMLETNNYVLRVQDVLKDIPKLFIAAHMYGLYKTVINNLLFQILWLPMRAKDRILKVMSKIA